MRGGGGDNGVRAERVDVGTRSDGMARTGRGGGGC